MKTGTIIFLTIFLTVLQTVILPELGIRIRPDLYMLLILYMALFEDHPGRTITSAFFIGILQDSLSGTPLGLFAFIKTLTAFGICFFSSYLLPENKLNQMAFVGISLLIQNTLIFLLYGPVMGKDLLTLSNLSATLIEAALNIVFALFLFKFFKQVSSLFKRDLSYESKPKTVVS